MNAKRDRRSNISAQVVAGGVAHLDVPEEANQCLRGLRVVVAGRHRPAAHARRLLRRAVETDVVLQSFQEGQQREGVVAKHAVAEYVDIAVAQSRIRCLACRTTMVPGNN